MLNKRSNWKLWTFDDSKQIQRHSPIETNSIVGHRWLRTADGVNWQANLKWWHSLCVIMAVVCDSLNVMSGSGHRCRLSPLIARSYWQCSMVRSHRIGLDRCVHTQQRSFDHQENPYWQPHWPLSIRVDKPMLCVCAWAECLCQLMRFNQWNILIRLSHYSWRLPTLSMIIVINNS